MKIKYFFLLAIIVLLGIFIILKVYNEGDENKGVITDPNSATISTFMSAPSEMKGSVLYVDNGDNLDRIMVDEITLYQDASDKIYLGKLKGERLSDNVAIDYEAGNLIIDLEWEPLNSFDKFSWQATDSIHVDLDSLRLVTSIEKNESRTEIAAAYGIDVNYKMPQGLPIYCRFSVAVTCDWAFNCPGPIDSVNINICRGAAPFCSCMGLPVIVPDCPILVTIKCITVECSTPCRLLGNFGCFCTI